MAEVDTSISRLLSILKESDLFQGLTPLGLDELITHLRRFRNEWR